MNTKISVLLLSVIIVQLSGCQYPAQTELPEASPAPATQTPQNPTPATSIATGMTEAEARTIAETTCIKGGEALAVGTYNENSQTWWFDANLNATKPGCNPACVVSEATKTAEINWRCTGLIPPSESANAELRQLFIAKYPQYAETITVTIRNETASHVRGSVSMEPGAPGGIFLAVKTAGVWQIVHDGNGEIPCALSQYDFPEEMLADCAQ